jgi:hypothetical protein
VKPTSADKTGDPAMAGRGPLGGHLAPPILTARVRRWLTTAYLLVMPGAIAAAVIWWPPGWAQRVPDHLHWLDYVTFSALLPAAWGLLMALVMLPLSVSQDAQTRTPEGAAQAYYRLALGGVDLWDEADPERAYGLLAPAAPLEAEFVSLAAFHAYWRKQWRQLEARARGDSAIAGVRRYGASVAPAGGQSFGPDVAVVRTAVRVALKDPFCRRGTVGPTYVQEDTVIRLDGRWYVIDGRFRERLRYHSTPLTRISPIPSPPPT